MSVPGPDRGSRRLPARTERRAPLLRLRRPRTPLRRTATTRLPGARLLQLSPLPAWCPGHPDRGARGIATATAARRASPASTPDPPAHADDGRHLHRLSGGRRAAVLSALPG